jgi:hypothetical protein
MAGDRPPVRGNAKRLLTADQERTIREALAAGASHTEAAAAAGLTYRRLKTRLDDQLRDVRVGRGRGGGRRRPDAGRDPTPVEIAVACALLRRRWTPDRWGLHAPDAGNDATRHGREIRLR